ncbi:phosphoribosylanthranilate isomerase [Balneola sp. MJW-20]|uniref:phosphoribosylanthranilate isomerase n=1 Tax=Gracilimonas aurantiaca TaxID=3234185 RepID=UPI0034661A71
MSSKERTRLKICGLTNLEDARFVSGAMADYLGFIFYEKSPRYIQPAEAGAIINWLEGPEKVGVFVNQPIDEVNQIAKETGIDLVQLHGDEPVHYCSLIEKPIIKVIHVTKDRELSDIERLISEYEDHVNYFLFDTKIDDLWGGTGRSFDWSVIKKLHIPKPYFVSGGLNVENISKAIEISEPFGVDLSSSLEAEPGLKDFGKIEDLMDQIREIWDQEEA